MVEHIVQRHQRAVLRSYGYGARNGEQRGPSPALINLLIKGPIQE
jgi:hypothetical protein